MYLYDDGKRNVHEKRVESSSPRDAAAEVEEEEVSISFVDLLEGLHVMETSNTFEMHI